eukprot:2055077-Prymnesium_polylepis.1
MSLTLNWARSCGANESTSAAMSAHDAAAPFARRRGPTPCATSDQSAREVDVAAAARIETRNMFVDLATSARCGAERESGGALLDPPRRGGQREKQRSMPAPRKACTA